MGTIKLPKRITNRLDIIARNLWMQPSRASLMVGAGMSRNAVKKKRFVKSPALWSNLADDMLKELHSGAKVNKNYLDVLGIAEEYISAFGRPAMDKFLEMQIPDSGLEPSDLHKMLMSLPWADVFTTNYDTILERAADDIIERRYERVTNKEKLVLSHAPRIVKLHGSFDTSGSYVISTEDYRRYPMDQAPLVNTMQQSLIENTLCLFGFSGDDPNFLNWIGWIYDNLGKSMPTIYMIGYLNLTKSKQKLLDRRKIIPIDIASVCRSTKEIPDALKSVIQYLREKRVDVEEWGNEGVIDKNKHFSLDKLKQLYKTYPGWHILPYTKREQIYQHIYDANDLSQNDDLELAYYVNWLLERTALPLDSSYVQAIETIITRSNPTNEEEIRQVSELNLALLRAYRESGYEERWMRTKEILGKSKLQNDLQSRYYYELCLMDICTYDYEGLRKDLKKWGLKTMSPLWHARHASLKAEFFDTNEAKQEMEAALRIIRKEQNLKPIEGNYELQYTESVLLFLLGRIKLASKLSEWEYPSKEDTYTERMHALADYYCDPLAEISNFEKILKPYQPSEGKIIEPSFDLNRINISYAWSHDNRTVRLTKQCMRVMEELAFPLSLKKVSLYDKNQMKVFIENLSMFYPLVAASLIIRTGNAKCVDALFGRKVLSRFTQENIDGNMQIYVQLFLRVIKNAHEAGKYRYQTSTIINVLPEILSRLVTKASFNERKKVLRLIGKIYQNALPIRVPKMDVLIKRLMSSFTQKEQGGLIKQLFDMPIPQNIPMAHINIIGYDPMSYLTYPGTSRVKIEEKKIEKMIEWVGGGDVNLREIACQRLYMLYRVGKLSAEQKSSFAQNLWDRIDENTGFPKDAPRYELTEYKKIPSPDSVDVIQLLRRYMQETPFAKNENMGVGMCRGVFANWEVIIKSKSIGYPWSKEEVRKLTDDIITWWDTYKKRLLKSEREVALTHTISEEYECRYEKIVHMLANVIKPNWKQLLPVQKSRLQQIAVESNDYTRYALSFQAIVLPRNKIGDNWTKEVMKAMACNEHNEVQAASLAIQYAALMRCLPSKCADALCEAFAYCKEAALSSLIVAIREIIDFDWTPTRWQQQFIAVGLHQLFVSSVIDEFDPEIAAETKLLHRKQGAELSYQLQSHCTIQEEALKAIISKWIDITKDKDEFCEIRNIGQ